MTAASAQHVYPRLAVDRYERASVLSPPRNVTSWPFAVGQCLDDSQIKIR